MEKLHNTAEYSTNELAPSEVQRAVLCSNNTVSRCTSLRGSSEEFVLPEEERELELLLNDIADSFIKKHLADLL